MNKFKFTVLAIVAAFATTAAASELEFHGYTRAGVVLNQKGGISPCFHLDGADTDYRLGNECDWVIEPNFDYVMAKLDDKSVWGYHIMPNAYAAQPGGGSLSIGYGQVYFYGSNIPWLANGEIWAGRRFMMRLQTGINDQFLENDDSTGFGLENMDLGFGKLSLAAVFENGTFREEAPTAATPTTIRALEYGILARLTNIQTVNKDSNLQIHAGYYGQTRNNVDLTPKPDSAKAGYRIAAYHTLGMGTAGNLLLGAKYAKNDGISNAEGSAGPTNLNEDISRWLVVAQYGVNVASMRTSVDVLAEYRSRTRGEFRTGAGTVASPFVTNVEREETWYTAGFRTDTQLSGPFRFLLEVGYDFQDNDLPNTDSTNLLKVTPTLAVSAGDAPSSRPTFRLFYTYASWNKAGALAADTEAVAFGATKKSGGQFGVQAEGWW